MPVYKYKTIEEANAHREQIELEHARNQRLGRQKTEHAKD